MKKVMSEMISDEFLQLITGQVFVGHGVLIAQELGLFKLLCQNAMTVSSIAEKLLISPRAAQALLSSSGALELVECKENKYQLSKLGKLYLDPVNEGYYGNLLELLVQQADIMNYSTIKKAILSDLSQIVDGEELFGGKKNISSTKEFIRSLYQKAFRPAFYWPTIVDLKSYKKIVDIGAGSGIYTISACLHNTHLEGVVCDRSLVVPILQEYINQFSMQKRIKVLNMDMWNEDFPKSDIFFFGDIFHDWPKEKCLELAKKSYHSLTDDGVIILHEMLFNDEKTKPLLTAGYNMKMMLWTEGQQFSNSEITDLLTKTGFKEIRILPSLGNWSIIIGKK